MMKRRIISILLSCCMMLTLLPTAVFAESNNTAVQEQFDLTVGETYYFYLTPNAENPDIPENSLHYVPFVYAGTVNAYTLTAENAETATVEEADASKYVHSLFIADNILQFGSIGDFFDLREHGMIYGREYKFGGVTYDLRAPSTGRREIFNEENQRYEVLLHSNEWDAICDKNQELIHNYSNQSKDSWSYGQDMIRTANGEQNLSRGHMDIRGASYYPGDYWSTKRTWRYGYRPVLEIKDAGAAGQDALRVLEVDLSGGLVDGKSTIRLVAGKGSSVTAPPIDGIRTPTGYVTEGFVWRGDNGQSYAPGAQIPAEVSSLTAVWKRETTGLMVGETYYFDLSGINYTEPKYLSSYPLAAEQIPSGTLNYVPFTFVGEVDAYVLNEKAYTQPDVDDQAAQTQDANAEYGYTYPHSLFLADCALLEPRYYGVFLNQENFDTWKTLLYGQAYTSGGVTYQMRAPSVGSPANNEWVQIMHKDDRLIVGKDADKAYIGQECNLIGDYKTVYRNSRFWSENQWKLHTLGYLLEGLTEYWRPVLELPQDVSADDYREVTLDLNGGKIGSDAGPVKLAVKNGSEFTAPKRDGLTPPEGSAGTYLRWVSEDGHYYMPGKPVPETVRKLTADWATEERFTLEPGKTYYFDLSGEGIPGTVNEDLPDTTLHYVPFTYSGNIAAYWDTSGYYQYNKIITAEDAIQNQHSLFVADYNVTNSVSWDALNERNLIFGRNYDGHSCESENSKLFYTMRAPTGGNTMQAQYPYECESPRCNEWDVLIDKDPNNIKNWQGVFSYAQEIYNAKDSQGNQVLCFRTVRGDSSQRRLFSCSPDSSYEDDTRFRIGYRPVLEPNVFEADAMQTVTLDLNGGKLGNSGDDIAIVVSKEEAFRAPASAGLTRPAGDESGTYFFWVDDNGQRYRPGEAVPVGTKKLTAQWCVRELFDLEVGGTYYFDLSGAGIPGVVNEDLPDTTLHYVPFTHVGTVEAYYDNRYLYGDRRTDAHSLLIADYNITNDVSLNALSDALIFGSKTKFGGVYYALRAPSIGEARSFERDENSVDFDVITPENNEWDMILKKGDYIKNLEKYESFGQFYGYSRGLLKLYDSNYGLLAEIRTWFYCGSNPESNLGYRPVLQILNMDSPNNNTGTVTLKLNGGTLGTSNETELKIVIANGASFTAPAREGLTPPAGKESGAFVWLGDDGLYYLPGMTVPAEVAVLTAQWDTDTYTVTYRISDDSGSETTVLCVAKAHDVPLTLKGKIYGRTGYKQVGWATSDGGEKVYELGGQYTENADVTLYPVWEKEHTHTYGGWSTDSTNHWHECTDPDCPNKPGSIKDTAEHTYGEDNKCSVCEYDKPVEPPSHTHTYDAWTSDGETSHSRICKSVSCPDADKGKETASHVYDDDADTTCNDCGYVRTIVPTTYTVTLPSDTGYTAAAADGSVSPVASGGSFSFTVTISSGFQKGTNFAVKANGNLLTEMDGKYTISNITENQTVTVEGVEDIPPTPGTYTVTLPSGTGYTAAAADGSTSPVSSGESFSFTVTISNGFQKGTNFAVKANGNPLTEMDGKYTISNITENQIVTVEGVEEIPPTPGTYTVTLPSGTGYTAAAADGSTSPVSSGESFSFTVTISNGFQKGTNFAVKANGNPMTETDGKYTISNITESQVVTVEGVEEIPPTPGTYTVTLPSGTGYTAAAADGSTSPVVSGGSFNFTVTISNGFQKGESFAVKANGNPLTETDGKYAISNITENQIVTVEGVEEIPPTPGTYTVTLPSGTGYTAAAADGSTSPVSSGESFSFTVTISNGFRKGTNFAVKANSNPLTANDGKYTISNITESQVVTVEGVEEIPPTPDTYTVSFDANGGSVHPASMTTGTNGKLASLPTPTRSSYSFDGWYTEKSGGTKVTTETVFKKETTVYAQWTYTGGSGGDSGYTYYMLTFETNGGSTISSERFRSGATVDLSKYTPTYKGHTFTGWYSDKGLADRITSVKLDDNKTVYAGWRVEQNPQTGVNPFTDVSKSDWFYDDVMFVYEKSLMVGTSDTLFSPYGTATRAMMASILWRMEGSPAPKNAPDFTDVASGKWYSDAIMWTTENGIYQGYGNGKFGPDDPITCEQLAAIFYRYADYKGYDMTIKGNLDKFKDKDKVSTWAQDAMQWAVGSGLIQGKTGSVLDPQGTATRAEIAAMLHRFIEKYGLVEGKAPGGMTGWIDPKRLKIPQTGDASTLGLWSFTLCASLAGCLALTTAQLRRKREEEALQIIEK